MVSHKHTNFLINSGGATAADIEGLGEEIRRRVYEATGIALKWEIHRIGLPVQEYGMVAKNDRDGLYKASRPLTTLASSSSHSRKAGSGGGNNDDQLPAGQAL